MKFILVTGVAAATLLAGCGGGGKDDALRKEVEALRQQVAATSTTAAPPTTVTTEASTTTSQAPVTTTTKPPTPTTQRATPTTQRATTTTTAPPTTTTTVPFIKPQGTVTWTVKDPKPNGPTCVLFTYTVFNRSDTALKEVAFANVYNQETYKDADGTIKNRWGNPATFPKQTVAAGIAPYGQGDVQVNWCPTSITPGSTAQFPVHIGEGRSGTSLTTAMSWEWFATYPNTTVNVGSCCAWWDSNTKTGHEQA